MFVFKENAGICLIYSGVTEDETDNTILHRNTAFKEVPWRRRINTGASRVAACELQTCT